MICTYRHPNMLILNWDIWVLNPLIFDLTHCNRYSQNWQKLTFLRNIVIIYFKVLLLQVYNLNWHSVSLEFLFVLCVQQLFIQLMNPHYAMSGFKHERRYGYIWLKLWTQIMHNWIIITLVVNYNHHLWSQSLPPSIYRGLIMEYNY